MPTASTVIGKYRVVDRLGQGGMGTLYLATDPALERLVAIKVLRGDFEDQDLRDRFAREARSISRLRHPNIVTIFEYGDHNGQPFIVMEYISGESFAEMIGRRAELPVSRKLQMIEELCAGMAYAHRAKIVHRDIKPANIMLDEDSGLVKILDFGIARDLDSGLTRFTQVIGTPSYMSPEQASGRSLDHRSDIFSIGSVFYELLTNRQAFDGQSQLDVMDKIARGEPAPLSDFCRGLDPAIVAIVTRALRKDPVERYQDLEAMRADIFRARESGRSNSDATIVIDTPRPAPATPAPSSQLEKRRASQIKVHLDAAAVALEQHDYEAAIESCEQVLLLDASNKRALELIDGARASQQQQAIDGHLDRARGYVAERSLTKAEDALAEALRLRSQDPAAVALQRELQIARRDQERARQRAAAAEVALERARVCIEEGAFESALRAASEVLAYAPDSEEAHTLKEQAQAGLDARRRVRELDRRAAEIVKTAREQFSRGERSDAIAQLEAFETTHPLVESTLGDLRRELEASAAQQAREEAERQRRSEEERRLEAERLREEARQRALENERRAQVAALLARSRTQSDAADYDAALDTLAAIDRLEPDNAEVSSLRTLIAEQRRAAEAAARRQSGIADTLNAASALLDGGRFDDAAARAETVFALDSENVEARALLARIQAAAADHRRRADDNARGVIEQASRLFDEGREAEALSLLARFEPHHADVDAAQAQLRDRAEAAQRARREEADRRSVEQERIRREAERQQLEEAAEQARREDAERRRLAEERRQQEEARRHAEEEQRRREEEEERRRVEEQRKTAEAAARARREEAERHRVEEERRRAEAEQLRLEEQQRRLEQERRKAEEAARRAEWKRQEWATRQLAAARVAIDETRFDDALNLLDVVQREIPDALGLTDLHDIATKGQERQRADAERAREIDRRLAQARKAIAKRAYAKALPDIEAVLQADGAHAGARALYAEVSNALSEQRQVEAAKAAAPAREAGEAPAFERQADKTAGRRINVWVLGGLATGAVVVLAVVLGRRTPAPEPTRTTVVSTPPAATLSAERVGGAGATLPDGRPMHVIPRTSQVETPPPALPPPTGSRAQPANPVSPVATQPAVAQPPVSTSPAPQPAPPAPEPVRPVPAAPVPTSPPAAGPVVTAPAGPPPPTAPDPAVVRANDEASIRAIVERYRSAYARRDAGEVARLVHMSDKAQSDLAKVLQSYSSFQVTIQTDPVVFRDPQSATIRFLMVQTFRGVGGRTTSQPAVGTFQLAKANGAWTIVKLEFSSAR